MSQQTCTTNCGMHGNEHKPASKLHERLGWQHKDALLLGCGSGISCACARTCTVLQASLAIMRQYLAPGMSLSCSGRRSFAASQQASCQDLQELIIHSQLLLLLLCQLSQLLHLALQHDPLAVQLPDL